MPETVIHILRHGHALCGQEGVPASWPQGHKWVSFEDEEGIKEHESLVCADCLEWARDEYTDDVEVDDYAHKRRVVLDAVEQLQEVLARHGRTDVCLTFYNPDTDKTVSVGTAPIGGAAFGDKAAEFAVDRQRSLSK